MIDTKHMATVLMMVKSQLAVDPFSKNAGWKDLSPTVQAGIGGLGGAAVGGLGMYGLRSLLENKYNVKKRNNNSDVLLGAAMGGLAGAGGTYLANNPQGSGSTEVNVNGKPVAVPNAEIDKFQNADKGLDTSKLTDSVNSITSMIPGADAAKALINRFSFSGGGPLAAPGHVIGNTTELAMLAAPIAKGARMMGMGQTISKFDPIGYLLKLVRMQNALKNRHTIPWADLTAKGAPAAQTIEDYFTTPNPYKRHPSVQAVIPGTPAVPAVPPTFGPMPTPPPAILNANGQPVHTPTPSPQILHPGSPAQPATPPSVGDVETINTPGVDPGPLFKDKMFAEISGNKPVWQANLYNAGNSAANLATVAAAGSTVNNVREMWKLWAKLNQLKAEEAARAGK